MKEILKRNKDWAQKKSEISPDFFFELAKEQRPHILYIGCSDARVPAEEMMGARPGEVFVHRNIANVVSNIDLNAISVITYAVDILKIKHIIICGHYGCGGVLAAMENKDMDILNPWLQNIRDVHRLHRDELDSIKDQQRKYKRLVELNVLEQCTNLLKIPLIQSVFSQGNLNIHGLVFDLKTGHLKDLCVDFNSILKEMT